MVAMDQTCLTCGDPCPNVQCIACWEKEVLGVVAEFEAEQKVPERAA